MEPAFDFDQAAGIVPYLAALGVSHVYCSPVFEAVPGSRHGYDVVDPTRSAVSSAAPRPGLASSPRCGSTASA